MIHERRPTETFWRSARKEVVPVLLKAVSQPVLPCHTKLPRSVLGLTLNYTWTNKNLQIFDEAL